MAPDVTLIAGRRRFSDEQKRHFLEEAERTSLSEVARRYDISRSLIQKWKDKTSVTPRSERHGFVRLQSEGESRAPIYLHIDSRIIVELPSSVTPRDVALLVSALSTV